MLPTRYQQHYQLLQQILEQLQQDLTLASVNLDYVMARFQRMQALCQEHLSESDPSLLCPEIEGRVRSYETEINKQLRLVGTDFAFLKAAKQQDRFEQRRRLICDRLNLLINYCNSLLQKN